MKYWILYPYCLCEARLKKSQCSLQMFQFRQAYHYHPCLQVRLNYNDNFATLRQQKGNSGAQILFTLLKIKPGFTVN